MFDLVEPIRSGPLRPLLQNTSVTVFTSCGSPAFVPVPWASTYATSDGLTPASLYTSNRRAFCTSPDGNVIPATNDRLSRQTAIYDRLHKERTKLATYFERKALYNVGPRRIVEKWVKIRCRFIGHENRKGY